MAPTEVLTILNTSKKKLWEYRSTVRPKPHRDEKVAGFELTLFSLLLSILIDFDLMEWSYDHRTSSRL